MQHGGLVTHSTLSYDANGYLTGSVDANIDKDGNYQGTGRDKIFINDVHGHILYSEQASDSLQSIAQRARLYNQVNNLGD